MPKSRNRLHAIEKQLEAVRGTQESHGHQLLLNRLHLKRSNAYMKSLHQHLMGTKRGRKGIFERMRTLEVRQKAILGVSSVVATAGIIGLLKALI